MKTGIKLDGKKILGLLEKYVDKVVLGGIAILCLVLLWKFVIGSPYAVEYNGSKVTPDKIDQLVNRRAEQIKAKLGDTPEAKIYRATKYREFLNKMALTVQVDTKNILNLQPGRGEMIGVEERVYSKPDIPLLTEAIAQEFRTVVFVPTETVDMEKPYEFVQTELDDVDVVSVQVSFDVQTLYANFERCFAGRNVLKSEWRDEQIAKPLFAAVQLQRQNRLDDGNWSKWQMVPRGRVDHRREIFQLPEKIDQVELGGIDLLMLNFNKYETQKGLLQPVTYDFAASNVEWLPPVLYKELVEIVEKEAKRMEREERGLKSREAARLTRGKQGRRYGGYGDEEEGALSSQSGRNASRLAKLRREKAAGRFGAAAAETQERTVELVRQDYNYALISETVGFGKMVQPLLIWAHDDTVKPDNAYRYRMRVGVFNPTAGKNWFAGKDAKFKDDVVLWSDYSHATEPVYILPMMYLFPVSVSRNAEKVTIDVAKFNRGNWCTHEFDVAIGENIGESVEMIDEKTEIQKSIYAPVIEDNIELIDFSSSAILVDIARAPILTSPSTARPRPYYQAFMTKNGTDISYLPVTKAKWPKQLQARFNEIKKAEDQNVQISETRGASRPGYNKGYNKGYDYDNEYDEEEY